MTKKDLRVVIIKGNVASGKTTEAYKLVEQGYKRVNKDELRRMADNAEYSQENERIICRMRDTLILFYLAEGFSVAVDDTNLAPIHERVIRGIVGKKATVEVLDLTHVPLEECHRRNNRRLVGHIDSAVIDYMYNMYLKKIEPPFKVAYIEGLPDVELYDMDGTLALHYGRSAYDTARCAQDTPYSAVVEHIGATYDYFHRGVILVSGREEQFRPETEQWLVAHGIHYDALYMRPTDNGEKDFIIKERIYRTELEGKVNVIKVWDDRNQTVSAWRKLGIPCFQVADGNF